jgi:hypothetical protein
VSLVLLAAGCAEPQYPAQAPAAPGQNVQAQPPAQADHPAAPAPAPPALETPIPRPSSSVGDTCGAGPMQSLVGRPRSLVPVPVDPSRQRVACTTCPVAQDHDPGRLNFLFDADTGTIREVRCG